MSYDHLTLERDSIDFAYYMRETEAEHKVKPASHWETEVLAAFAEGPEVNTHPRLPWPKLSSRVALRPGETSLWFGFSGAGKSLVLGQAMLSLRAQGDPFDLPSPSAFAVTGKTIESISAMSMLVMHIVFSPPIANFGASNGDTEFKDADPRFLAYTVPSTNPIHSLGQLQLASFTGLRIGR